MIYVGWSAIGAGLFFSRRSPLSVAATAFVTAMILMIAHWNWMDPAIGTLQPVLNSYWLMLHVAVIVASYGPFALGMLLGAINLLLMIFTTKNNALTLKKNSARAYYCQRTITYCRFSDAHYWQFYRRYVGKRKLGALLGLGS